MRLVLCALVVHFIFCTGAPTPSQANVYDFGAKGDGKSDDTAAFQKAIQSLQNTGGTVYCNDGQFLFEGSFSIPKGVSLIGTYKTVPSNAAVGGDFPNRGTILMPVGGRGDENGPPFITINEDASVSGLVVYYPRQVQKGVPAPYPWTFDMKGNNPAISDVECLNCWNAIRAVGAGRHFIARVQGQPINTGIYVDQTYDIGRIEDVHWNPWYSNDKEFMSWQLLHGRAFVFARTDWEYVLNTFAFGYAIGYHFISSAQGSCNGNFLGIGADMAVNASIKVDAADPWGILITNGEFTSFVDPQFGVKYGPSYQILDTSSNSGSLKISNSAFWGPSDGIALLLGSGTTSFSNCVFSAWDAAKNGNFAITANGTGVLQLTANEFQQDGKAVYISRTVRGATVVGNTFNGSNPILNNCKNAQIGLNIDL